MYLANKHLLFCMLGTNLFILKETLWNIIILCCNLIPLEEA